MAEVRDLTDGEGADLVVNATGFPGSFASALGMVRDAGTIVEVGAFVDMGPEAFNPLMARHAHEVPFAEMVSHTFRVADAAAALETSLDAFNATKVLISNEITRP